MVPTYYSGTISDRWCLTSGGGTGPDTLSRRIGCGANANCAARNREPLAGHRKKAERYPAHWNTFEHVT